MPAEHTTASPPSPVAAGACSRSLLFPGPLPPLSHLGVTLMRQVVGAGLRYALHNLGAPMPERPPVRIVSLRLYLDGGRLGELLAGTPGGEELVEALVHPDGVARRPLRGAPRGAATFHRLRLRLGLHRRPPRAPERGTASAWQAFRALLSAHQPHLGDALLGELLSALARRQARAAGRALPPVVGPAAHALLRGGSPEPARLGHPDPLLPAWSRPPTAVGGALGRPPFDPLPARDRHRGRFRESYRAALERLRTPLLELAEGAAERGLIERPADAFFLPLDLGEELGREERPSWLRPAVARNRAEYESLVDLAAPADDLEPGDPEIPPAAGAGRELAPLWPLG